MYMHFIPIIFRFYVIYFWKTDWGSQVTPLSMKRNFILRGLVAQAVRHSPPTAGSRVRVSLTPCGFRGGRNGVWVGFSRGFSRFLLPQISFHHFSTLISSISFHFISPCDGASGVFGRPPCYSRTYNLGASSHLIPRPDLVLDTSWGYLYLYFNVPQR